jgi:leucine dehydrogenase
MGNLEVFTNSDFDNHELVTFHWNQATGLKSIIAIHDRSLGPGAGGCRIYPYENERLALADALRLSRAMTLKNALAGLPLGGGKAVIMSEPGAKTEAMLESFGKFVGGLGGRYVTGEDVGCSVSDMDAVRRETQHVMGTTEAEGDPSAHTARGVFLCMAHALRHRLGKTFAEASVAVKGVGNVGAALASMLVAEGAKVLVADVNRERAMAVATAIGAEVVDCESILSASVDVFAPCALGGDLSEDAVGKLGSAIVCGAANNQLATPAVDFALNAAGILYCPDYLVNAGGIIAISRGITGWSESDAHRCIESLPETLKAVLAASEKEQAPTGQTADAIAQSRILDSRSHLTA